jgi:hypothetical protein
MRSLIVTALLLSAGAAASAQDVIRFKEGRGQDVQCEVKTLNYKTVEYEPSLTPGATLKSESKDILEILINSQSKSFDFGQGEQAMNNNDYDAAIERFERVRKDPRAVDLIKQTAAINVVRCHFSNGNVAGSLAAVKSLRQERPDSFYLLESYDYEIRCHLARKDIGAATQSLAELENRKSEMPEWGKLASVRRAGLLELQGKFADALAAYRGLSRDKDVGEDAMLGELRCLRETGNWNGLMGRGEQLIGELRGKKGSSPRLLMGAFNARGEASLNANKAKDALLDFMQGVLVLGRSTGPCRELEVAVAKAAVSCARLARDEKDKGKKETYKHRAQELQAELEKVAPGSSFRAEVQKALQEVR